MSFSKNFETVEGVDWKSVADHVSKLEYSSWTINVDGTVTEHEGYDLEYLDYLDADMVDTPNALIEGWEPIRGITGQYGYNGAVMHPSEYIGAGLCKSMAEDGGMFYAEYVQSTNDDDNLVGWCLLKRVAQTTKKKLETDQQNRY